MKGGLAAEELVLAEDIGSYSLDPVGYVKYAFPWGSEQLPAPGPRVWQADILSVEEGTFHDGVWVPRRLLNGDETNGNNYLIFRGSTPTIQKVKLYRHD